MMNAQIIHDLNVLIKHCSKPFCGEPDVPDYLRCKFETGRFDFEDEGRTGEERRISCLNQLIDLRSWYSEP